MSEAVWKRDFDASFFDTWGGAMGGLDAVYTPPAGAPVTVQVLMDVGIAQFGDDLAPVSHYDTYITFRREQLEPAQFATVVVDGVTYTLAQRVDSSDESLSRWGVQHG